MSFLDDLAHIKLLHIHRVEEAACVSLLVVPALPADALRAWSCPVGASCSSNTRRLQAARRRGVCRRPAIGSDRAGRPCRATAPDDECGAARWEAGAG